MIIVVPLNENDEFSPHFGASTKAALFEVDPARRAIERSSIVRPPEAEPCSWADWLGAQGVGLFLSSGMGRGAQQRMAAAGIAVVVGVAPAEPGALVQGWLNGAIVAGANACEDGQHKHHHDGGEHGHHHHAGGCGCSH